MKRLVAVCAQQKLDPYAAGTFVRGGGDPLHAIQTAHFFLDRQQNPFLDLFRTRAGIGNRNGDHIQIEFRKYLLFDLCNKYQAANHQGRA